MKIFQVGGSVRDTILGVEARDKDWVVVGSSPEEMIAEGFKPIGKDFPVFLHPQTNEEYALARTEKKSGKGYKGFKFYFNETVTLEDDLKRRDFTINSIARDKRGDLIDPYGGLEDIKNKTFRQTSNSFSEDPLRSIRYAKFKTYPHLADFALEESTEENIKSIGKSGELNYLSADRVWMELKTALDSPKSANFFSAIISLGLTKPWFPSIKKFEIDESNTPQLKWVELELLNNFSLGLSLELPKEFVELSNLSFQLANLDINSNQLGLISELEKINFHRHQTNIEQIIKLKYFDNKRDYLSKLKDNILSKDFSILSEVPKEDMTRMKTELYIKSIKESK
tara:strand:+ start:309 stop:1328 length:1020 start_codon:yes stop_codon:yes gene_type:complete